MQRRRFIGAGIGILGVGALGVRPTHAHTPFNQWVVYRRKHLLIGCHKDDLQTYTLAKQIVAILRARLPAAQARVARAPNAARLASLLGTEQLDVALLGHQSATKMAAGIEGFEPYGVIALATLFFHPDYLLVGRQAIPAKHAWLLARALYESELGRLSPLDKQAPLDWHTGASLFFEGAPLPES